MRLIKDHEVFFFLTIKDHEVEFSYNNITILNLLTRILSSIMIIYTKLKELVFVVAHKNTLFEEKKYII